MDEPTSDDVAHIVVQGGVQGVGFRAWVHHQAELRGLDGWVRNRRDGSVEVLIRGRSHDVQAMVDVCGVGPASARVDSVTRLDAPERQAGEAAPGSGFRVLRTV